MFNFSLKKTITSVSWFAFFFFVCCGPTINDGEIVSKRITPPHNQAYSCGFFINKIYYAHTCYTWVPDTTYFHTIMKVVDGECVYREISVSNEDYYQYDIGDEIRLTDQ